jgi:hypothetical protein
MPEEGGDGFEGGTPTDALRRQRVPHGVGVDMADAGPSAGGHDVTVDGAPVERLMVVAFHERPGGGPTAPGPVVVDQAHEHRVEGDGSVVVSLAMGMRSQ